MGSQHIIENMSLCCSHPISCTKVTIGFNNNRIALEPPKIYFLSDLFSENF